MKTRFRFIVTGVATLLSFCACTETKEVNDTHLVLTAYQENLTDTKTSVEDGGSKSSGNLGTKTKSSPADAWANSFQPLSI